MLKKLRRNFKTFKTLISKTFNNSRSSSSSPSKPYKFPPLPLPLSPSEMSSPSQSFRQSLPPAVAPFPQTQSTVLPDPSNFFAPHLLSSPLPTNSFFQNFTVKNGDQPEYIHPYLIKSSLSAVSISYPSMFSNTAFGYQVFNADWTVSENPASVSQKPHIISSFSDLSLILDTPSGNLRFFLVRGSPFITFEVFNNTPISISTIHAILSFSSNSSQTKFSVTLNNNQTWLIYSSSPINLTHSLSQITSGGFSGIVRIAVLPNPHLESILDRFCSCYPVSGEVNFRNPSSLEYKWEKNGWGNLLMLAHPLHLRLLSSDDSAIVLDDFKYKSIDGDLVGVVGGSWVLKPDPVSITWHSINGIGEEFQSEIISALVKDVEGLKSSPITTTSSYFYGKAIARAARLALIAEEVNFLQVIPEVRKFLKDAIEPWLRGTFNGNGFLYDSKWGGLVTQQGASDSGADFGFGVYNDHHYHIGYFLYAIAVLVKIDPAWGRKFRPQAYSLMADFMNLSRRSSSKFPRLRCFDLYKLHSWASGLTEFADGRNQESSSEAVNAYYSAALLGLAYGDTHLASVGSTLTALEIKAAQTWWQIRGGENLYETDFARENKVVGVLWSNKRDSGLWFAPPDWRECRLGIQLLPLLPITEALFSDAAFAKELVDWTLPSLRREGVGEGWKGFAYALQGIYDKDGAVQNIRNLKGFDDGSSLSNLLWWIHSRGGGEEGEGFGGGWKHWWFSH
ncbi:probable endo-1,3(4)-beta-glucanase ARB_01444 [Cucurbita moschata]|uniref:glucan endo-1,3-beta-D-glucosidase n=1 Tax=Cucurbita moschata TaxID=3662 RepID=A0A6J1GU45_CUCMO|nr:probable endo-1,3(4)-beta-glucanase ARB_01444 [Cucurbita moschata]